MIMAKARAASLPAVRLGDEFRHRFRRAGGRHQAPAHLIIPECIRSKAAKNVPEGLNSGQPIPRHY